MCEPNDAFLDSMVLHSHSCFLSPFCFVTFLREQKLSWTHICRTISVPVYGLTSLDMM